MSNKLSMMPNISIPRTKFNQVFNHATSFKHGYLYPIDCFEIIPGDTYKLELASLIRMSNPIVPLFANIKMIVDAFFVPLRLIWDEAEMFYGDPTNHGDNQSILPDGLKDSAIPSWAYASLSVINDYSNARDAVSYYLGKPILKNDIFTSGEMPFISNLKERGYYTIWNEYYRPSQKIIPVYIDKSAGGSQTYIGTDLDGNQIDYFHSVMPVCKQYDYFVAATLSPQFGDSVELPLGTFAPVGIDKDYSSAFTYDKLYASAGTGFKQLEGSNNNPTGNTKNKLVADLSSATAATINDIRFAFQVQKYLERSNYGSRYFEILNAHYGVTSPDGRLQRPDHLGHHEFYINVNQVLSTAGATDDSSSKLGQPGAVSVTGDKTYLFNASFTEPGYLYVMVQTKFDRSYAGGILREDKRKYRLDFYSPEFANLGDQVIYKNELQNFYKNGNNIEVVTDEEVFGYQEHWAEYRYRKDRISGILNPNLNLIAGESVLNFWTLADTFDLANNEVSLSKSFLFEDRASLASALVTGEEGPDYICDFNFKYTAVRELPFYSIPGLIDHFGAL